MNYKMAAAPVRAEYTVKRSRFIASVSPCESEKEATDFINKTNKEFRDARHNCFAYILKDGTERFSDDGEPQGTAGMPILENIRRRGLVNTAVVVTRYFGGILLGAPGLVRAYNHTTSLGLDAAQICEMRLCDILSLSITYDFYARAEILVRNAGGTIQDRDFKENVVLKIIMPKEKTESFRHMLTEASGAVFEALSDGETYVREKVK